ncbi:hypothetical protein WN943_017062 [Citrus x changshan-huyou]
MLTEEMLTLSISKFHHPQHKKIKRNAYGWVTTTAAANNNYKSPKQRCRSRSAQGENKKRSSFGNKKRTLSGNEASGAGRAQEAAVVQGESGNEANGGGVN